MPLSSRMCELSTEEALLEVLMLCRAASPAKICRLPERCKGSSKGSAVPSGRSFLESYAKWNQDSCLWKTSQGCLFGGTLELSLETWPRWGLILDGELGALVQLEPHIHAKGCSLWPTPVASDGGAWKKNKKTSVEESTAKYLRRGGTLRAIYFVMWNELSPTRAREFYEWMMGWPKNWTGLDAAATEWFLNNRCRHGGK